MKQDSVLDEHRLESECLAALLGAKNKVENGHYLGFARQKAAMQQIALIDTFMKRRVYSTEMLAKLKGIDKELEEAGINRWVRFVKLLQRVFSGIFRPLTRLFSSQQSPRLATKSSKGFSGQSAKFNASLGTNSQRKSLSEPPVPEDSLQASAPEQGKFVNPTSASAADSSRRVHFSHGGGESTQESLGRESRLFSSLKRSQSREPLARATGAPAILYLIRNPERIDGLLKDAHAYVKASKGNWEVSMSVQSPGVYTAKFDETIIQMSRQHGANGLVQIMEVSVKCPVDKVSETKACEILMKMIPQLFDPSYKSVVTLKQDATFDQLATKLEQSKQHPNLFESSPKTTRLD